MENVVDGLYMAGSMLIFIVALSVAISSFTMVRTGIDDIIGHTETVDMAQFDNGEYVNYMRTHKNEDGTIQTTRIVSGDTVFCSIYRALKENYVIYLDVNGINSSAWNKVKSNNKDYIEITIDPLQVNVNNMNNPDIMKELYEDICQSGKTYIESLGEYQEKTEATSENKITYRIITYDLKT